MPLPIHPVIGVDIGGVNLRYASIDQRLGAWRRCAVVGTGLQSHIGNRSGGFCASLVQRNTLRMGAPALCRYAAPDNAAILHQQRADAGVGAGQTAVTARQSQASTHPIAIGRRSNT